MGATEREAENPDGAPSEQLVFMRAVFAWCLRNARRCLDRNAIEEGLQWDLLAARLACADCYPLVSPELEAHLIEAAARLPVPGWKPTAGERPHRWLHVFTEVCPIGGHTAMAARWMRLDPEPNRHSVALLGQTEPVPDSLVAAARRTGGDVLRLAPRVPLVDRASRLREHAWKEADVVVLHTHSWDVVATVALAVPGGPPVVLVNHAAHAFWVGGSVADLVLNCRGSAQEQTWTTRYRSIGADRSTILPIPLPGPAWPDHDGAPPEVRKAARTALHLPFEAPVLLTVGRGLKYAPMPGVDFLEAASSILRARPDAYLLAVGPAEDSRWGTARAATGGRLRAVGCQHDVTRYHAAADVYLEGFPEGSTTALLEAGLEGIPCVLAPRICPPPFVSDGLALAEFDPPATVADYVERAVTLLESGHERQRCGRRLAAAIRAHHARAGWVEHLRALKAKLPPSHRVYTLADPSPVPRHLAAFGAALSSRTRGDDPLGVAIRSAVDQGLNPRSDRPLKEAVHAAKHIRAQSPPADLLLGLAGLMVTLLPPRAASFLYEMLGRMWVRARRLIGLRRAIGNLAGQSY